MMQGKQKKEPKERSPKTVFGTVFTALVAVLAIEIIMLVLSFNFIGLSARLDNNAEQILDKQVANRAGYLSTQMISVQDLTELDSAADRATMQLVGEGQTLSELTGSNEASVPFFEAVSEQMVNTLRDKSVTGVYIVLNTGSLTAKQNQTLPCLYIRDLDPTAPPSAKNDDMLLERAPTELVHRMSLSTSGNWQPGLAVTGTEQDDFFRLPYERAQEDNGRLNTADYGRWSTESYTLTNDNHPIISYTQPLILPNGTVYGVIGVEMLTCYVQSLLPSSELQNNGCGTYFLAYSPETPQDSAMTMYRVVTSSADSNMNSANDAFTINMQDKNGGWARFGGLRYYASVAPLSPYSRNAPFSEGSHWMLVGTVSTTKLFEFSRSVQDRLTLTVLLTVLVGLAGCLLASRRLTEPIVRLSEEVAASAKVSADSIPHLSHTGIEEIDRFAAAITDLSRGIINTSTKFLRIMDMASIELAGYELRPDTSVYTTGNFFSMLGLEKPEGTLSSREFEQLWEKFVAESESFGLSNGGCVFRIPQKDGTVRYIRLRVASENRTQVGLLEDVTSSTEERLRIEHERDYDMLSGLYNRKAFNRICENMFRAPARLGHAALMMLDLDNLKKLNDVYGHDTGDRYIRETGHALRDGMTDHSVCSRLSGDEFMVLFYGYDSRAQLRRDLNNLQSRLRHASIVLPNGDSFAISISGGVACYPEDGRDLVTLKKYADFAMYQVKRSHKGGMQEFDIGVYNEASYESQIAQEFEQMLAEERITYHFQPIFACNGEPAAYEALMRPTMPNLHSPGTVMKLAKETGRLYDIEKLTMFHAPEIFRQRQQSGLLDKNAWLFVNSIASVCLAGEDLEEMRRRVNGIGRNVVVEITEEVDLDLEMLHAKRNSKTLSGLFALDDYGSGYSNESNLIALDPDFIKIDISIIRGIDSDPNKQEIVRNIVSYAHQRGMQIVAEGVETAEELRTSRALGADLFQGYFLSRPGAVPSMIAPAARDILREFPYIVSDKATPHN